MTWAKVQCAFIPQFSETRIEGQAIVTLQYVKQKKYEPMEDYYDKFLRLCVIILQRPNDINLRKPFQEGLRTKIKMVIINMPRKIVAKVAESAIIVEEELPMRWKNIMKYCQNVSDSDEFDDSNNLQGNNSFRQK